MAPDLSYVTRNPWTECVGFTNRTKSPQGLTHDHPEQENESGQLGALQHHGDSGFPGAWRKERADHLPIPIVI